ncbi:lysylphosphatidylglycerol synthase transmembrane domain-containing protein [Saliphagus sp. GCM10025334]
MRRLRVAAGFAVALLVTGILVYGTGWEAVVSSIRRADPILVAGGAVAGATMLALRALIVYRLLGPIEGSARGADFVGAFLAGYFSRSVVPWGQSVGVAVTAYLLAGSSESPFEDNAAVISVAEVLVFLTSVVVAVVGLVGVVSNGSVDVGSSVTVGSPPSNRLATGLLGALFTAVLVAASAVSVTRDGVARTILFGITARLEGALARLPGVERAAVRTRVRGFLSTIDDVAADRSVLLGAVTVALASWIFNALALFLSLIALGIDAPFAVALLCVPLSTVAAVVPLPGGMGGVEVFLAGLLVATTAVSSDVATAAALLYRLCTYWVHVGLGGIGATYVSATGVGLVRVDG